MKPDFWNTDEAWHGNFCDQAEDGLGVTLFLSENLAS
jgi:hypothetical protein